MSRLKNSKLLAVVVIMVIGILMFGAGHVLAQSGTPGTASAPDLLTKVGIVAGIVATIAQGVKKFVPAVGGYAAIALNLILSLGLAYQSHPTFDIQFALTTIAAALASSGIHSFLRPAGVTSSPSPITPNTPPVGS